MAVYTTWNSADKHADITLSNGDLTAAVLSNIGVQRNVRSKLGIGSGKFYWESTCDIISGGNASLMLGVADSGVSLTVDPGSDPDGYVYFSSNGTKRNNSSYVAYGDAYITNDVISVALDMDAGKLWWARNGVWQDSGNPGAGTGEAYSGITGTFYAIASLYSWSDQYATVTTNFGASAFSYSVPSGFSSGLYEDITEKSISEDINVTSEFEDNFGELNEDVNVTSEFACLVADSPISENVSVDSEITYFESDSPISEDASVSSEFISEHTGNLSEDISVNAEISAVQLAELSEDTSINSEFVCYQRPANIDAELPMITADLLGGQGGFLDATLPLITADIKSGALLEVSLPAITASLEGKVGTKGDIDAILPKLTASVEGKVEILGEIDAELPVVRAYIVGKTGDLATCEVALPMLLADIQGVNDLSGDIDATLPTIEPYMIGTVERLTCTVLRYNDSFDALGSINAELPILEASLMEA